MEMGDYNLDEMFDLKPIKPEMYTSSSGAASADCTISSKLLSFENSKNNSNLGYSTAATSGHEIVVKPQIINFSSLVEDDESLINGQIAKRSATTMNRTPLQAQDHVMSERKRRQKLSQLFITLSKLVPGLKKLDKASLLEDAIDHLKALQQRVSTLDEEKLKSSTSTIDPISNIDDDISGTTSDNPSGAPEIKAMISESCVLIKVCCENQKGLMSRIPWEMEKMHLAVKDMRIMPFGGASLVITILAQMQNEFRGTVKDIISQLEMVFLNPRA